MSRPNSALRVLYMWTLQWILPRKNSCSFFVRGWSTSRSVVVNNNNQRSFHRIAAISRVSPPSYRWSQGDISAGMRFQSFVSNSNPASSLFSSTVDVLHDNINDSAAIDSDDEAIQVPARFVPHPFAYQQELEVEILTLTNRGLGLGRVTLTPEQIEAMQAHNDNPPRSSTSGSKNQRGRRQRNQKNNNREDPNEQEVANMQQKEEQQQEEQDATTNDNDNSKKRSSHQWVVFVPSVIPGEVVRVRIFRNFKNYSEADLVEIVKPSPDRVIPVCSLAGDCGGCQLQHMTIESQRRWKTQHVQEALRQHNLLLEPQQATATTTFSVEPCLGTPETLGYRSKLTPHYKEPAKSRRGAKNVPVDQEFAPETKEKETEEEDIRRIQAIGFQKQSSRQIVDVPTCHIATPTVNTAYMELRAKLFSEPPKSKRGATLLLRQGNLEDEHVETGHQEFITTTVNDLNFTYRAGNFFQNNYYVLPLMVDHEVSQATRGGQMTHLVDCYCGSGLFALSSASYFDHVVGIEINDKAIVEAQANADANGITNCEFLAASAENIFSVIAQYPRDSTAVILDPPRKGCSVDFLQQLQAFAPARIVYMSCDHTTQARDAASLVAGNYTITSVQPFDLFPQTRHIECLMILERNDLVDVEADNESIE